MTSELTKSSAGSGLADQAILKSLFTNECERCDTMIFPPVPHRSSCLIVIDVSSKEQTANFVLE